MSAPKPTDIVAVRAIDGRWNYGPAHTEALLRSEEFGVYPTAPEAWRAGQVAMRELDQQERSARIRNRLKSCPWLR